MKESRFIEDLVTGAKEYNGICNLTAQTFPKINFNVSCDLGFIQNSFCCR